MGMAAAESLLQEYGKDAAAPAADAPAATPAEGAAVKPTAVPSVPGAVIPASPLSKGPAPGG